MPTFLHSPATSSLCACRDRTHRADSSADCFASIHVDRCSFTGKGVSRGFGYATLPSRVLYHKCAKLYHNTKWKGSMMQIQEAKPNYLQVLEEEEAEEARKLKQKELWSQLQQKASDETAAQHRAEPPQLRIRAPPKDRFLTKRVVVSSPKEKQIEFEAVAVKPPAEMSLREWDKAVDLNVVIDEMYHFGKGLQPDRSLVCASLTLHYLDTYRRGGARE